MGIDVYVETDDKTKFTRLCEEINKKYSYNLRNYLRGCGIYGWQYVLAYLIGMSWDELYFDYWLILRTVDGEDVMQWSKSAWTKYNSDEPLPHDGKYFTKVDLHKMSLFLDVCSQCNASLFFG